MAKVESQPFYNRPRSKTLFSEVPQTGVWRQPTGAPRIATGRRNMGHSQREADCRTRSVLCFYNARSTSPIERTNLPVKMLPAITRPRSSLVT